MIGGKKKSHLSEGLLRDFFEFHQRLRVGHLDYSSTKTVSHERESFPKETEELLARMSGCQVVEESSEDHMVSRICKPEGNLGPLQGCKRLN